MAFSWQVSYDRDISAHYVDVGALSAGTTNPNAATHYENVPVVEFLRAHDPWFHDINSPAHGLAARVNSPDNVP